MNYIAINKVFHYRARKTPTPVPFQIHNCIKKNSKNCDLWKITRQHKKIFNTDIDNLFTNCIKLDLFIIQNWYQNFHLFLHVETNKYNRDSKFILCNPSIQSLGSQGARKKKLYELELSAELVALSQPTCNSQQPQNTTPESVG